MHRRAFLMSATAISLCACATPEASTSSQPVPPTDPGEAFDVALYRTIAAEPGNQFVSAYSVSSAFALVYPGAVGQTASEIQRVFGFNASPLTEAQQTRARAEALLRETGGSEFTVANAAWVEQTMSLRPEYARMIREELNGTIEPVPFIANQTQALNQINAWAARETRDRIPSILSEPDRDRRLVLTNAVYFKGKWRDPFVTEDTRDGDFYTGANTHVRARLMQHETATRYFETPAFQAADFDYDDGAFALAIFLPRERTGLAAFERELTGESLTRYMDQFATAPSQRLNLTLPKIEMKADYSLGDPLKAMGVELAFSDDADFSRITADLALKISAVIHKTFLAINEEGTEAAAVTAVDMVMITSAGRPPPPPPIEFKADHPFFIVLHHKPTRTRLFMGRIATTAT